MLNDSCAMSLRGGNTFNLPAISGFTLMNLLWSACLPLVNNLEAFVGYVYSRTSVLRDFVWFSGHVFPIYSWQRLSHICYLLHIRQRSRYLQVCFLSSCMYVCDKCFENKYNLVPSPKRMNGWFQGSFQFRK